mgnify:CR=1 FL=1
MRLSKWEEQLDFEKLPLWSDCEAALNKRFQHISADESSSSRPGSSRNRNENAPRKNNKTSLSCTKFRSKQARKVGLKFNKTKSKFMLNEIKFIGHVFSKDGVSLIKRK